MTYLVESVELTAHDTAVVRGSVPETGVPGFLAEAFGAVTAFLTRWGMHPVGPPFARFEMHAGGFDVEAGMPVAVTITGDESVQPGQLPAGPAARTTHVGRYEEMGPAYDALLAWVRDRGGIPAGAPWEVYLTDPVTSPDPQTWRTEVLLPYAMR
jgi:effector-binding domain-containing protein